jgi:hypothetical protein
MKNEFEHFFWKGLSLLLMALVIYSIAINFYYPWEKLLFENSDFEKGNLKNWTAEGTAFLSQPTLGDNTSCRGREFSNLRGKYWIGTYENHPSMNEPSGSIQGDGPTGGLTSVTFVIQRPTIGFMLGAGDSTRKESVALVVDGREVLLQTAWGDKIESETMSRIIWDVRKWEGKHARLILRDDSSGPWGHINVDDFRYL